MNRYCASRTLYGLALDGHAPKLFTKTTRSGIPIYAFCLTMVFPFLSFLSVGSGASQALKWLANLTQASQLLDYVFMCITYLFFYRALKAQGYDRKDLPYRGWGQPYVAYAGLACMLITVGIYGYTVFLPGWWNTGKQSCLLHRRLLNRLPSITPETKLTPSHRDRGR